MSSKRIKTIVYTVALVLAFSSHAFASEKYTANECFEKFSRGTLKFNQALDKTIFKPVAKGYRALPVPIRTGSSNFIENLRSLLTFSNNVLQGDLKSAGNTAGRFAINTTVGILGVFDPASKMGLEKKSREDFGQTLGVWGADTGCYFVLPVLGPTTARDALGMVGNVFIDPVYQLTHGSETDIVIGNENVGEHNYYIYKGTDAVDFRSKNIESIDSLEKNSIDFYASVKSLYLQNRAQKISNSPVTKKDQDDSDWEEIDNQ
jgi:phospholipid-binding lipoprotein MlaA